MAAIREKTPQPIIRQTLAICQRQPFNPRANGERENAAIVDTICQTSKVQAFDEVSICEVRVGYRKGSAN